MSAYTYLKQALRNIPKPCAFVDLDAFEQNIQTIIADSNGKKIRIASKSIRSVTMLRKILAASEIFQGIMCFTPEEAIYLSELGFDDLLIAYPVWNEQQLERVSEHVTKGKVITVMVDSLEHLEQLEKVAKEHGGMFLVCLDLDLSSKLF